VPARGEYVSGRIDLGPGITGVAHNETEDFVISTANACEPAEFVFASLDGQLIGFNDEISEDSGTVVVDNAGAVYTGVAFAGTHLLAANFAAKQLEVYDTSFKAARDLAADAFTDPELPDEYGPFNVMATEDAVFVAYAELNEEEGEEEAGPGLGIVDMYDFSGNLVRRIADAGGDLNAPWGMAMAPAAFGAGDGALIVGNFGDGRLSAYDVAAARPLGLLQDETGAALVIDGLWGITFGDDDEAGLSSVLYFAAGPDDETHGLYGRIELAGSTCSTSEH
jgi:uncharacterized protein (TIGR03118 family)